MDIETKVRTMEYSITDPLVVIYNEIEELARLANAANNPFSDMQQVQIGLRIIKNTNDFEQGIEKWYARPVGEHTWTNFKTHFEEAREMIKKVRGADMRNSAFQQVNFVANEVRAEIAQTQESILQAIAENQTATNSEYEEPSEVVNAATTETTQLAILQLLKQIKDDMKQCTSTSRNPRRKFYCWTHGACCHKSSDCRNKKDGHQDDATFNNKKNGSTKGCNVP